MPLPAALQRLIHAALAYKVQVTAEPVHYPIASAVATVAAAGSPTMRRVARTALESLDARPTAASVWQFTREWWYARAVGEILAYEADRLTPEWAEKYVCTRGDVPREGAVLVSIHQFSQHVAAARAASVLPDLGLVTMVNPRPQHAGELPRDGFLLPVEVRTRPLNRFYRRFFGDELYAPGVALRHGLDLLRRGGSLIVLADFYGTNMVNVLGRSIPVAPGAIWWARQSGRPIVPFCLTPPRPGDHQWLLECGAPISPTHETLVRALEGIIRRAPTTWMSWRGWAESPPWLVPERPVAAPHEQCINASLLMPARPGAAAD